MRYRKVLLSICSVLLLFIFSSCVYFGESDLFSNTYQTVTVGSDESDIAGTPSASSHEAKSEEPSVSREESTAISTEPESQAPVTTKREEESELSSSEVITSDSTASSEPSEPPLSTSFYERLIDANLASSVLSTNANMLVRLESAEENSYWFYSENGGSLSIDASRTYTASMDTHSYNVREHAYYSLQGEEPFFCVIPLTDTDGIAELFGLGVFHPKADEATLTREAEDDSLLCRIDLPTALCTPYDNVRYTYVADPETLILKSATVERIVRGETVKTDRVTFTYNEESFVADTTAYDLHAEAADRVKLYLVTDTEAATDIEIYHLASDTRICASSDADGTEYALYKNRACTKDVQDLSEASDGELLVYLGEWLGDVSFEYTLIERDLSDFCTLLTEFKDAALEGRDVEAVLSAYNDMYAMYEYIETQANVAYINYFSDQTNVSYRENYSTSNGIYSEAYSKLRSSIAQIAASDSPIKEELFAGWTADELEELQTDDSGVAELQNANNALLMEYFALNSEAAGWGDSVNLIYEQLVENFNAIAKIKGYGDYYEYASLEKYSRDYSKGERDAFRAYVKEYIVPLYVDSAKRFRELSLTALQSMTLNSLISDEYTVSDPNASYIEGYYESFESPLKEKMEAMLEKNGMLIGESEGAYDGAFTMYLPLYEEPVVYFGPGYTDLLTVIHENGHYAAYYGIGSEGLPGLDLCETHSQGNEWLFMSYMEAELDPAVYEAFMLSRLLDGLQGIIVSTLVDECEETIYTAETPYTAAQYDALIAEINETYGSLFTADTIQRYFKNVALNTPVYYISYATSEMASIALYIEAEENFDTALAAFSALVDNANSDDTFLAALADAGLPSPFEEATFTELTDAIGAMIGSRTVPLASAA
ncbi:MAG: hypothetical protein E7643_03250 [Ruminococcaceae bacterium]|nr:hypothetical protein [Oscillospiraceae bacterium]